MVSIQQPVGDCARQQSDPVAANIALIHDRCKYLVSMLSLGDCHMRTSRSSADGAWLSLTCAFTPCR